MLNISLVQGTDGNDFDFFSPEQWAELVEANAVGPDDGTGYPCIKGKNDLVYKVHGHTPWPLNPQWDGVIWYSK